MLNYDAWLHGLYNFEAVSIAISNAFREKGQQPDNYPLKPHDFDGKKEKMDEDVEIALAESYMKQMVRYGKNWKKK